MQRSFFQRSDRVKGVDVHPTEPWYTPPPPPRPSIPPTQCSAMRAYNAAGAGDLTMPATSGWHSRSLLRGAATASQRSVRRRPSYDIVWTDPCRLLANLYSGHVYIWNYNDQTVVKSFEVTELPGPSRPAPRA